VRSVAEGDQPVGLDAAVDQLAQARDAKARRQHLFLDAATQTTKSTLCSAASADQRLTMWRSSCGGSVNRVAL